MKRFILTAWLVLPIALFSQSSDTLRVYFDFDRFELHSQGRSSIDDLLSRIGVNDYSFELRGHCDWRGTDAYNETLSKNRVQAVRRYLIAKGVGTELIDAQGFGERIPASDNTTDEGRTRNRRVEIVYTPTATSPEVEEEELKQKLADSTLTVGSQITLRNINFEGGRSIFLEESYPALKELLDAMKSFPQLVIRIEGHICCQPGDVDGLDMGTGLNNLSEARARAVHNYLIANGIDPSRLSFKGFGHSIPLYPYPETNEAERVANRRVEIRIMKK